MTNHAGSTVEDVLFTPWGDVLTWTGTGGFSFAETPYYDYGVTNTMLTQARLLGPNFGRWFSPDPWGGKLEDPQTLNRYSYVRSNPLSLTDPTGLDFYLQCQSSDHSGCTQVQIDPDNANSRQWVQADQNGNATIITSLSIWAGENSATVNGNGVVINGSEGIYFDNPESHMTDANGNDINLNPITLSGDASKGFGGFTFDINGNCGGTCLSSGSFQFAGTPDEARAALMAAGAWSYVTDSTLDQLEHPNTEQFRFGSGPSPHFSLPYQQILMPGSGEHELTLPKPLSTVPASGGFHVDETTGLGHATHTLCGWLGLGC